jgi:hypothetical protein
MSARLRPEGTTALSISHSPRPRTTPLPFQHLLAVAFQDVGHEDTFGTIAATLKTLLHTTDEVFGRIETRVRVKKKGTEERTTQSEL